MNVARLLGSLRGRFALAVMAGMISSVSLAPALASSPPLTFVDAAGIHVTGVTQIDQRDYNVEVLSAYLGRPVNVRILLPVGYAAQPDQRYPVLYLFHGTSGRASDWIDQGGAKETTAPYSLITVMPDAGFDGDGGFWFTNWVDTTTSHGPSQYESYLIDSLIPWIDTNLRTIPGRTGRAVAGLSQGGYGSSEMAARHPDMFVSMASFSGAPEIQRDPEIFAGALGIIEAIEVGDDHVPPFSELGNPVTDVINWEGHDPATLDGNLRGMSIYLWTGEGLDGPYDQAPNPGASGIEGAAYQSTQHFYDHLVADGIPAYYDDYVYGTHSFPYWARDLRDYVPWMMNDFAHPSSPSVVSYTSVDRDWSQWGYGVSIDRSAAEEFSSLTDGSPKGFLLTGSGTATVTTPADYEPGRKLTVTVDGPAGSTTSWVRAGPSGRINVVVPLGSGGQGRVTIGS
jgi:S-formylglutathione hydrolase FrmB